MVFVEANMTIILPRRDNFTSSADDRNAEALRGSLLLFDCNSEVDEEKEIPCSSSLQLLFVSSQHHVRSYVSSCFSHVLFI